MHDQGDIADLFLNKHHFALQKQSSHEHNYLFGSDLLQQKFKSVIFKSKSTLLPAPPSHHHLLLLIHYANVSLHQRIPVQMVEEKGNVKLNLHRVVDGALSAKQRVYLELLVPLVILEAHALEYPL